MAMFNSYVTNYQRVPTITLWSSHSPPTTHATYAWGKNQPIGLVALARPGG